MIDRVITARLARTVALAAGAVYLSGALPATPAAHTADAQCGNACSAGTCWVDPNHQDQGLSCYEGGLGICYFDTNKCSS